MKKALKHIVLTSLLMCFVGVLVAQPKQTKREKIAALRVAFITKRLNLTTSEAEKFWPLYNEMNDKQNAARRQFRRKYNAKYKITTDAEAEAYLNAEGEKESEILRAEGEKQAVIKRAEAEAQKMRLEIEAEALTTKTYIEKIKEAGANKEVLQIIYMDTLKKLADGQANKVFIPTESMTALGGLAAAGELFKEKASTN